MLSEGASENKSSEQNQNSHLFGLVRRDPGGSLVLVFFFFFTRLETRLPCVVLAAGWSGVCYLGQAGPKRKGIDLPPPPKCGIKGV